MTKQRHDFNINHKLLPSLILLRHRPSIWNFSASIKVKVENGHPLVKGKKVTGFSDTEKEAVGLSKVVPFLLEDELKKLGAHYSKGADWASYTQHDGLLITGQNPASSEAVAKLLLKTLAREKEVHH